MTRQALTATEIDRQYERALMRGDAATVHRLMKLLRALKAKRKTRRHAKT